jgi:hypothetical protein
MANKKENTSNVAQTALGFSHAPATARPREEAFYRFGMVASLVDWHVWAMQLSALVSISRTGKYSSGRGMSLRTTRIRGRLWRPMKGELLWLIGSTEEVCMSHACVSYLLFSGICRSCYTITKHLARWLSMRVCHGQIIASCTSTLWHSRPSKQCLAGTFDLRPGLEMEDCIDSVNGVQLSLPRPLNSPLK